MKINFPDCAAGIINKSVALSKLHNAIKHTVVNCREFNQLVCIFRNAAIFQEDRTKNESAAGVATLAMGHGVVEKGRLASS